MLGQEMDYSQGLPTPVSGLGTLGQAGPGFDTDTLLLFAIGIVGAFYFGYRVGRQMPAMKERGPLYRTHTTILKAAQGA